jgi:hypothetical protein
MKPLLKPLALCLALGGVNVLNAQVTVGVNPAAPWIGYMNVFNLPSDGGAYQFGSSWGTADLVATFSGAVLTLTPNTINDPSTYWYIGGGKPGALGNKIMDANMYVEDSTTLPGQVVTFTGLVLGNTLTSDYSSVAFIKDFVPDYSSSTSVTVPLTPGTFSITLATVAAGHHIQYGFETMGRNVWATDVGPYGSVQITAVPEPGTLALLALGSIGFVALRNRRHS